jgi:hypothetical protein
MATCGGIRTKSMVGFASSSNAKSVMPIFLFIGTRKKWNISRRMCSMKFYPSIPRLAAPLNKEVYVFLKYDGSQIRVEWTRKKGFHRFGTRHRLFDKSNPVFGEAIDIFKKDIGQDLVDTLKNQYKNIEEFTIFCEFFGPNSFAGQHAARDKKELRLFDVNVFKQGVLSPHTFVKLFSEKMYSAKFLGQFTLNEEFIQSVRSSRFNVPPHMEGVACKWGEGHNLEMAKIKTEFWLKKLKEKYAESWQEYE